MVLLDHIDWIGGADLFGAWTLMGLGFSDAAEVFVFLSGYTCGWVYTPRLIRKGWCPCQKKVLWRALQIYVAFLMTASAICVITARVNDAFAVHGRDEPHHAVTTLKTILMMDAQPAPVGVLCMYAVVVP